MKPVLGGEIEVVKTEKGIAAAGSGFVSFETLNLLKSTSPAERSAALHELAELAGDDSFALITASFDDPSPDVRNAAAHALRDLHADRAASFTRALREASPERRRRIGTAIAESGLATEAVNKLAGESRERTYDAFSILFLMAKAGEVHPLMQAVEEHQNTDVRLAVVRLLALSGQPEIVPAFRRLAVRGSLPTEVRAAVMEAIYQISSQARETAPSAAEARSLG
jgi:HEAT repeat protein